MRQHTPRMECPLRTTTPSSKHVQRPQPITREEIEAASHRLTPEECRDIMAIAYRRGWAWVSFSVDYQDGDSKGVNA